MVAFVVLASFTDQGVRNVKETIGRAEAFKEMAKKGAVAVKDLYWDARAAMTWLPFVRRLTTKARPRYP